MGSKWFMLMAATVLVSFVAGVRGDDNEEKVSLDQLPKAVAASVKKRFPGAKLTGASKEVEDGKTQYEVSLEDKGQKIDVILSPEGQIQNIEKTIVAKDLPRVVADALEAKYPKATVRKIEELIKVTDGKERLESYEVLLTTAAKKKLEVLLGPDGKVIKETDTTPKK
jgi:hypothetical protein